MSKFRREEDEADKWLREHDPYYTEPSRSKTRNYENYYLTPDQERKRLEREIPFSNLSISQAQSVGLEIDTDDRTGKIQYNI